tara:strand:- start:728 stop:1492 length:765 start_codon:yes stop_codon:yes gene_type:complete
MDEEINIADVVIMVDIIFGGNARILNYDPSELAYIDLKSNYDKLELVLAIEYSGMVRGLEFDLNYDPNLVEIGMPTLSTLQEDVILSNREMENGKIKVIAANIQSGGIQTEMESYLTIPFQFKGSDYQISNVFLENVKIAGANGDLIEFVSRMSNAEVKTVPSEFALLQNFPNPFNPSTEIKFSIPKTEYVSLNIYNTIGQKVRSLKSENMVAGYHSIIWDGTNDSGKLVSTGMYFYSIKSNKFNKTRKMLFLK